MEKKLTILVNTSDGFEDCWQPFFKLFTLYWPECNNEIVLNTEMKNWSYPNLNIICSQVGLGEVRKLTWSECLIKVLKSIKTDYVLYLQEDYFIENKIDNKAINSLIEIMEKNIEIKHIGLTHFGSHGPFKPTLNPMLWIINQKARYRISCQAGLWRKDVLLSYLEPEENGWMFEIFGTKRARKRKELFLTVNRDIYNPKNKLIVKYKHTGIIKGKWHPEIPNLFKEHDIDIDFNIRGFYHEPHWILRKIGIIFKILKSPKGALKLMFP